VLLVLLVGSVISVVNWRRTVEEGGESKL
jgi:hypothetical protein